METPYGAVSTGWRYAGDRLLLTVKLPANTTATLELRDFDEVLGADGVAFEARDGALRAELGAGAYQFWLRPKD